MNSTLELRAKWEQGNPEARNEYNNIRFAKDKFEAGKQWLLKRKPTVNFEKPRNLADWICKYKYEDLNPAKPMWADKIGVYQRLYDIGLEDLHIPMLGEYGRLWYRPTPSDIQEVLKLASTQDVPVIVKCNHGSGWNLTISPGERIDLMFLAERLTNWLETNYAYIAGYEWQYESIVPGLLVQPCLEERPLDWQFYCLHGDIVACDIQRKYGKSYVENLAFVDSKGNRLPWYIGHRPTMDSLNSSMKTVIQRMCPYVEEIARQFKFVRVDLFNTPANEIKFCEATFAPCSGILDITYRD